MTVEEMISKQRTEKLISLGYCERVYTNSDLPSSEYPHLDKSKMQCYKEVPLSVTDEQFEKIISIGTAAARTPGALPAVLNWLGIAIYLIGFIVGLIMGKNTDRYYEFSFGTMLAWWAGSLASGIVFQWMGAVLKELRKKL